MEALRVLHLHDKPPGGGGIRAHVELVERSLTEVGVTVKAMQIASTRRARSNPHLLPRTYWRAEGWMRQAEFLRSIAEFAPHVVHLHAGFTALAAPLLGLLSRHWPVVASFHDVAPFCPRGDRRFMGGIELCEVTAGSDCLKCGCWRSSNLGDLVLKKLHRVTQKNLRLEWFGLDELVFPSRYLLGLALQHGAPESRCSVVPHCVSPDPPQPIQWTSNPQILFVGQISEAKGADLALSSLPFLGNVPYSMMFLGDGPQRGILEQRVRALGLQDRISFKGWCSPGVVRQFRQQSILSLLTSRVAESSGLSGLESLAASRPVVGIARAGAADWLIDGVTGVDVGRHSPELIGSAMKRLLLDRDLTDKLGRRGFELVNRDYHPSRYGAHMLERYRSAIARASRRIEQVRCAAG